MMMAGDTKDVLLSMYLTISSTCGLVVDDTLEEKEDIEEKTGEVADIKMCTIG